MKIKKKDSNKLTKKRKRWREIIKKLKKINNKMKK